MAINAEENEGARGFGREAGISGLHMNASLRRPHLSKDPAKCRVCVLHLSEKRVMFADGATDVKAWRHVCAWHVEGTEKRPGWLKENG